MGGSRDEGMVADSSGERVQHTREGELKAGRAESDSRASKPGPQQGTSKGEPVASSTQAAASASDGRRHQSSPGPGRATIELARATNVPVLNNLSSDPYLAATLHPLTARSSWPSALHNARPSLSHCRSGRRPCAKTLNPTFDARWIVAGIPASGFKFTINLLDEDPGNRDDRLGKAIIHFPDPNLDPAY